MFQQFGVFLNVVVVVVVVVVGMTSYSFVVRNMKLRTYENSMGIPR